jgi:hypothetical protein
MTSHHEEHPNAMRLDALAVGERDDEAKAHVAACAACASYVEAIAQGAATFARDEGAAADKFVQAVRTRAIAPVRVRRRTGSWMAGATTVLALAACLLLLVRGANHPPDGVTVPTATPSAAEPVKGPIRLKGGMTVNAIVERGGVQLRKTGPLDLAPGDRLRIEIALDENADIAAGVLADDGEWAELQAPAFLTAGMHYSERSVFFRSDVPTGWLLVGAPDAIATARRTRDFAGLVAVRVQGSHP